MRISDWSSDVCSSDLDAVEMRFRTNHRPEMPHHLDIVELGDRRLGDILERLAGGIGSEVEVDAAHRGTMASARGKRQAETRRPPLWIRFGIRGWPKKNGSEESGERVCD